MDDMVLTIFHQLSLYAHMYSRLSPDGVTVLYEECYADMGTGQPTAAPIDNKANPITKFIHYST